MRGRNHLILALAAGAIAVTAAGCGGGDKVPAGAVAKVGDAVIPKTEFDRRLEVRARGQAVQTGSKKKNPVPKKGTSEYKALRDGVMQSLITESWNAGEAEDLDIKVTDSEVKKRFEREKKQFFPKEKDYRKFLRKTGQTDAEILERVRAAMIAEGVQKHLSGQQEEITILQITDYYNKNQKQFTTPEQRELQVVVNNSKKKIEKAKKALDGGESFDKVVKKYSTDQGSKARKGKVTIPRGLTDASLDASIFGAKEGEITGPIKISSGGWLLFKVLSQVSAKMQPLKQVKEQIKQTLTSKARQDTFNDFQNKWKKKTICAEDYRIQLCKNAPPKPKQPATGQPPGSSTPPQQPPPSGQNK